MDQPAFQKEIDDKLDGESEFSKLFANIWGKGWRVGFYEKKPIVCPFVDMKHKAWFNMGVTDGIAAKSKMEE